MKKSSKDVDRFSPPVGERSKKRTRRTSEPVRAGVAVNVEAQWPNAVFEDAPAALAWFSTDGTFVLNLAAVRLLRRYPDRLALKARVRQLAQQATERGTEIAQVLRGASGHAKRSSANPSSADQGSTSQSSTHDITTIVVCKPIVRDGLRGAVVVFEDMTTQMRVQKMRDDWVTDIVHDLRQAIHAIRLHATVLGMQEQPERIATITRHIANGTRLLERLASDLVDESLITSGKIELRKTRLDLGQLAQEMVDRCGGADERITLECLESVTIHADRERMEQVLMNLLSNALKYRRRETKIRIVVTRKGDQAVCCVTNEGGGISASDITRIFQRFRRDGRVGSGPPGQGTGLSIARGLLDAHGGQLWAESEIDKEAAFSFALPIDE